MWLLVSILGVHVNLLSEISTCLEFYVISSKATSCDRLRLFTLSIFDSKTVVLVQKFAYQCLLEAWFFSQMAAPSPWSLAVAAALAASLLFVAVDAVPPSTDHGIMSIKNDLPYAITIVCHSNVEKQPSQYTHPAHNLQFDFDTKKHLTWTCTFESEAASGTFIMWKSPAAGGPGNLCLEVCQWRADLQGLKVLRNGTSNTVLVYMWH